MRGGRVVSSSFVWWWWHRIALVHATRLPVEDSTLSPSSLSPPLWQRRRKKKRWWIPRGRRGEYTAILFLFLFFFIFFFFVVIFFWRAPFSLICFPLLHYTAPKGSHHKGRYQWTYHHTRPEPLPQGKIRRRSGNRGGGGRLAPQALL